jgi:hypothetical protein
MRITRDRYPVDTLDTRARCKTGATIRERGSLARFRSWFKLAAFEDLDAHLGSLVDLLIEGTAQDAEERIEALCDSTWPTARGYG